MVVLSAKILCKIVKIGTYSNNVGESHDGSQNSRRNHDSPHWQAQVLDACRRLVEIAQCIKSQDDHGHAEEDEARFGTEHGPELNKIGTEESHFGDDEEETDGACDEVGDAIEEEELFAR